MYTSKYQLLKYSVEPFKNSKTLTKINIKKHNYKIFFLIKSL